MRGEIFSFKKDLHWLEEKLKQRRYGVICIEPFLAFMGDKVDTYRSSEMQRLLAPVTDMADRHGTTIIANIHFNKNSEALAIDRISDSRGIGGTFRVAYGVVTDPDDDECALFLKIKNNIARRNLPGWKVRFKEYEVDRGVKAPAIEWLDEDNRKIDAVLSGLKVRSAKKGDAADAFLRDILSDGRRTRVTTIEAEAQKAGLAWRTVRQAYTDMGGRSKRDGFGPGAVWYWSLPEE
jgi:hypothetical protein